MNATPKTWNVGLIGECMIELQASPTGTITQTFGGDTLNTAVYLARMGAPLGVRAEYISAVGDDSFSDAMLHFWQQQGVGASLTRRLPGRLPGLYFIELEPDGERVFRYWRGEAAAKDCFSTPGAEELLNRLAGFDALYLSGISLGILHEDGRRRLLDRLAQLRALGVLLFFDCNFRPRLWGAEPGQALQAARPWYAEAVNLCQCVLLTGDEAPALGLDAQSPDLPGRIAALGPEEVIVKNGGEPCLAWHAGQNFCLPSQSLAQVVDTTAAGDSFSAAYLLGRHLGLAVPEAMARAHTLAAAVIGQRGAIIPQSAMPDIFSDLPHKTPRP